MSLNKVKYFGYFKLVIKQKNYPKMLTIKRFWLTSEIPILIDTELLKSTNKEMSKLWVFHMIFFHK